jgi:peptide chain release factor 3
VEAWPGDILGVTGKSNLEIGDTLTENTAIQYHAIPRFAPECFVRVRNTDTRNLKRFNKGIEQLMQEKVVQRFYDLHGDERVPLLGAVGPLQFEVVQFRLQSEYGADSSMESLPWTVTRWVDPNANHDALLAQNRFGSTLARDDAGRLCILFESDWNLQYFQKNNPDIALFTTPQNSAAMS